LNAGKGDDALLERHPYPLNDLRIIKPQIEALIAKGVNLKEYTVSWRSSGSGELRGEYQSRRYAGKIAAMVG